MKISVNNKEVETSSETIAALVEELSLPSKGIAVAVAGCMVPRAEWGARPLAEGMRVVVIKAACGG